ncbi:hypothetical protein BDR26DRAFT_871769 [Obelidium mucronatum]|nr:hypothetical protein BDR26DRAFT_871769 [Obelidium mucronatum]
MSHNLLIRLLTVATSLLVFITSFVHLSHYYSNWRPAVPCGEPFTLLPPPKFDQPDPFLRTHLPFIDGELCMITQTFAEATNREIMGLIASLVIPMWVLVAVESTRGTAKGPCGSFSIIGTISQVIGISIAIPSLWLPSFAWSQPIALAKQPENFSKVTLGSVAIMNRIAFGFTLFTLSVFLVAFPAFDYNITIAIFQYLPTLLPVLWASFTLTSHAKNRSTTIPDAQASSNRAKHIYYALIVVSTLQYISMCLIPLVFISNNETTIASLVRFAHSYPSDIRQLMNWFLLGEYISVTISILLFVSLECVLLGENAIVACLLFLGRGLVIGNGASLLVFCVWREEKIMERLRSAMKGKKRA